MYRDLDKDSVIASLREDNEKLKKAINNNQPLWGVKVISVSFNEDNENYPYSITIEFIAGARVVLNMTKENFEFLGSPTAGSVLNLFLFPPKYLTKAGFYKE